MAPPKFEDLGKDAKDLLSKSYNVGEIKLEGKTMAANETTEFVSNLTHNTESGAVGATLETKWKHPPYGVLFTEKWNTDNVIMSKLTYDQIANLTLDAEATFEPVTGKKSSKVKASHVSNHSNVIGDIDLDFAGPTVNLSGVFGYGGWHAGYQASYDTANSKLVANNVALGYKGADFTVHGAVLDATKFTGSVYHSVNGGLAVGAQASWAAGTDATSFTLGLKKDLDSTASIKAKVDNSLCVGLSYTQNVGNGLSATLSGLVNGKQTGGHKVGLHLTYNA